MADIITSTVIDNFMQAADGPGACAEIGALFGNRRRIQLLAPSGSVLPIDVDLYDVVIVGGIGYREVSLPDPGSCDGAQIQIYNNSAGGGNFQTLASFINYKGTPTTYVTFSGYENYTVIANAGIWEIINYSPAPP